MPVEPRSSSPSLSPLAPSLLSHEASVGLSAAAGIALFALHVQTTIAPEASPWQAGGVALVTGAILGASAARAASLRNAETAGVVMAVGGAAMLVLLGLVAHRLGALPVERHAYKMTMRVRLWASLLVLVPFASVWLTALVAAAGLGRTGGVDDGDRSLASGARWLLPAAALSLWFGRGTLVAPVSGLLMTASTAAMLIAAARSEERIASLRKAIGGEGGRFLVEPLDAGRRALPPVVASGGYDVCDGVLVERTGHEGYRDKVELEARGRVPLRTARPLLNAWGAELDARGQASALAVLRAAAPMLLVSAALSWGWAGLASSLLRPRLALVSFLEPPPSPPAPPESDDRVSEWLD